MYTYIQINQKVAYKLTQTYDIFVRKEFKATTTPQKQMQIVDKQTLLPVGCLTTD